MASMVFYNNGSSGQLGQFSDALTYAHLLQNEKYNNDNDATGPPTGRRRRDRTHFSERAIERLEASFTHDQYPDINTREQLADELGISEARVQVWFQNKRSRLRRGKAKLKTVQSKTAGTPKTPRSHHNNNSPPNSQQTSIYSSSHGNRNLTPNINGAAQLQKVSPINNSYFSNNSNHSSPSNEGSPGQTVVKPVDHMLDTSSQDSFSSHHSDNSFTEDNNFSVSSKVPPPLDLSKESHEFTPPNPNPARHHRALSQPNDSVKSTTSVLQSGMCSPFTLASPFFPYPFPYGYTPMMEQRPGGYYFSPLLGSEYPKTSASPTTMPSILSPLIASPMGPRAFLFPSATHNLPSMNFTNSGVPQPQHGAPTGFNPFGNYGEALNTPKLADFGAPSPKPSPTSTTRDSPNNKENGDIHSNRGKEKDINVWD